MTSGQEDERRKQPNSRTCFACGVENEHGLQMTFYEAGEGVLHAVYRVPSQFQGFPGIVHGGIVASMLDEMVSRVAMIGEPNRFRMTAKLEVRYRQPVPTEQDLELHARLTRSRGRVSFATADVRLPDGTVAAEAEGMLILMESLDLGSETLEQLGWKIYPDLDE
jgi:acyl-coenzyme A thioesterase PaaI-like protein